MKNINEFIEQEDYQKHVSNAGSTTQVYTVLVTVEGVEINPIYLKLVNGSPKQDLIESERITISDEIRIRFPNGEIKSITKKPSRSVD